MKLISFIFLFYFFENEFFKKILLDEKSNNKGTTINVSSQNKEIIFKIENSKIDTNTYFCKLENFDNEWIKTKYPTFRYTNLEGGVYRFLWEIKNQSQIGLTQHLGWIEIHPYNTCYCSYGTNEFCICPII